MTVAGVPTLSLNDGGTASYTGGSGSAALRFSTTVGASDSSVTTLAVTAVNLPGGATITDAVGGAADLAGAVTGFSGLGVDPGSSADAYADGFGNAATGPAELPSLLGGYAVRPAWKVAGVDYQVGTPGGLTLQDPTVAANLPAGVSIDSTNDVLDITQSNVTLSGFDFSLHGGWGVVIEPGVGNTTIADCNFSMLGGEPVAIDAASTSIGSLTVEYCSFNGNSEDIPSVRPPPAGTGIGSAINYFGSGSFVAEYDYIHAMPADGIDFSDGTVTPTIEYNLFEDLGTTPGAHPDPVQFYGDAVSNALIAFNTIYQPQDGEAVNEGLAIEAQGGSTISATTIADNTIIATGPTLTQSINIGIFQDTGNTTNGVVVEDNYLDPTGAYGPFGSGGSTIQGSNLSVSGNVDLVTGAGVAPTEGTFHFERRLRRHGRAGELHRARGRHDRHHPHARPADDGRRHPDARPGTMAAPRATPPAPAPPRCASPTRSRRATATSPASPSPPSTSPPAPASRTAFATQPNLQAAITAFPGLGDRCCMLLPPEHAHRHPGRRAAGRSTQAGRSRPHRPRREPGHHVARPPPHRLPPPSPAGRCLAGAGAGRRVRRRRPGRDLLLSPDHAVFVDGVLIPVRHLVNGATIAQEPRSTTVDLLARRTGGARLLLAEGLPGESYLDTGNRGAFANGGGFIGMRPTSPARFGKPGLRAAGVWGGTTRRGTARATEAGGEDGPGAIEDPVCLLAMAGPAGRGAGRHWALPSCREPPRPRLCLGAGAPAQMRPTTRMARYSASRSLA